MYLFLLLVITRSKKLVNLSRLVIHEKRLCIDQEIGDSRTLEYKHA